MPPLVYTTVLSGQKISADVDTRKGELAAIGVPTVTSADLYVQGGFDTTSASFYRLVDDVGDIAFPVSVGSRMVLWPAGMRTPGYLRAEFSAAQTDVRTLTFLVR